MTHPAMVGKSLYLRTGKRLARFDLDSQPSGRSIPELIDGIATYLFSDRFDAGDAPLLIVAEGQVSGRSGLDCQVSDPG